MLLRRLHQFIEKRHLIAPSARVLVGLSGGVDSVVLLHLLYKLEFAPVAAHVNYRLRGAASEEDEVFVRALCQRLGVPVHIEAFDTAAYADEHRQSIQEAARDLRYDAMFLFLTFWEGISLCGLVFSNHGQQPMIRAFLPLYLLRI